MDLIPIGEAARRLEVSASALRYYDELGLVPPAARAGGRRMYGRRELRRVAFLRIAQRLGLSLDTAGAVLDSPAPRRRSSIDEQIGQLDELIARASQAREFLVHARDCPAEHPARDCPTMTGALDALVDGRTTVDRLAGEAAAPTGLPTGLPSRSPSRSPTGMPSRSPTSSS
ncbi:MerR family transcriptional regulator [Nonomuraea soli]|uniref:DNA-binding transcriptional MerR regulator n=1 Tax=Nonomuraea soli TaxID=1032476 RepID=A0A7W0CS74_9ACTN|nr:MerR family transcriptional regulator [Nonomuraea soli]MBA2896295.1 DNA-binding transcriptional MerR regulator [Nonomuraea soli]